MAFKFFFPSFPSSLPFLVFPLSFIFSLSQNSDFHTFFYLLLLVVRLQFSVVVDLSVFVWFGGGEVAIFYGGGSVRFRVVWMEKLQSLLTQVYTPFKLFELGFGWAWKS
ncbi:uncharacterized protein LOC131647612 [Vicia villosa]|uniref:uncharacterized protein LOC131647612 n=1 Tax=Vicia villosa TaxID=3911 RepID=UPI00273C5E23|nr:uncharacterized protein LOC131647612 [Vicia villosa]